MQNYYVRLHLMKKYILLLYFLSINANSAIVTYTDRSTWEAALIGLSISTETFDNPISEADVIILDNGIVSTKSPDVGVNHLVDRGLFIAYTTPDGFEAESITWEFPKPILAFGGDFTLLNPGQTEVNINSLNFSALLADTIGSPNGFFGLISPQSFNELVFINDNTGGDAWRLDNFSSLAVPIPAAIWLFFSGIGCLFRFCCNRSINNTN